MIKSIVILLVTMMVPLTLLSSYNPLSKVDKEKVVHSDSRIITSLQGKWLMSSDNEKSWESVYLPASFDDKEKLVFKKNIKIDKSMLNTKAWQLHLIGIEHYGEIFINDVFIGKFFGYGTPQIINIPKRTLIGENNTLKIIFHPAVDNEKLSLKFAINSRQMRIGGFREILLVGSNNIWIDNVIPRYEFANSLSTIKSQYEIFISSDKINKIISNNSSGIDSLKSKKELTEEVKEITGLRLVMKLADKYTGDTVHTSVITNINIESERTKKIIIKSTFLNLKIWDVDKPNLYTANFYLYKDSRLIDKYVIDQGFYNVETNGSTMYINNKKFAFKGLTYYEDVYKSNITIDKKRLLNDIKLFKLLGANTIFVKSTNPNPLLLSICDSIGLFVLAESPSQNIPDKMLGLEEINKSIKNIGFQAASYYQKYSSILGWGVSANLDEEGENITNYINSITKALKKHSNKLIFKTVLLHSDVISHDKVDFLIVNNFGITTDFYNLNQKIKEFKFNNKSIPLVFMYGALCNPNNHNGYSDPLSLDFQAYNISNCYKISADNYFSGSIIQSFNDYIFENSILSTNYYNRNLGTYGVFNRARKFRTSLNTIQSLFNGETEPLLNVGSYTEKSPMSFLIISLVLIALILLLNRIKRFREYYIRSLSRSYNFYADVRDQRVISSSYTMLLGLISSLAISIFVVSILYVNRYDALTNYLLTLLIPGEFLKGMVYDLIWNPNLFILLLSLIIYIKFVVLALIIKALGILLKARIYFGDSFTIAVWSANPIIIFLALNLFNIRLMTLSPTFTVLFVVLLIVMMVWIIGRLLRCLSVVFDKSPTLTYGFGIAVLIVIALLPILYYTFEYNLSDYLQYALTKL